MLTLLLPERVAAQIPRDARFLDDARKDLLEPVVEVVPGRTGNGRFRRRRTACASGSSSWSRSMVDASLSPSGLVPAARASTGRRRSVDDSAGVNGIGLTSSTVRRLGHAIGDSGSLGQRLRVRRRSRVGYRRRRSHGRPGTGSLSFRDIARRWSTWWRGRKKRNGTLHPRPAEDAVRGGELFGR